MGSNNPMGLPSDVQKILFHPFYTVKDLSGNDFVFVFMGFFLHYFSEADNFMANLLSNTLQTNFSLKCIVIRCDKLMTNHFVDKDLLSYNLK